MGDFVFSSLAISDRTLKALAKEGAPNGRRLEIRDANHPGFIVHVNDRGKITFLFNGRFPGQKSTSRRSIGTYGPSTDKGVGVFTLADARAEAERWRTQAKAGKDPREETKRIERAHVAREARAFEVVAEDFIKSQLAHTRKGHEVANDIRREFVSRWKGRPIAEIETDEITKAIEKIRQRAPYQARNVWGYACRLFGWAKRNSSLPHHAPI